MTDDGRGANTPPQGMHIASRRGRDVVRDGPPQRASLRALQRWSSCVLCLEVAVRWQSCVDTRPRRRRDAAAWHADRAQALPRLALPSYLGNASRRTFMSHESIN